MLVCPKCSDHIGNRMFIERVVTTVELIEGTDAYLPDGLKWDNTNPARCSCGWTGTVADLIKVDDEEYAEAQRRMVEGHGRDKEFCTKCGHPDGHCDFPEDEDPRLN